MTSHRAAVPAENGPAEERKTSPGRGEAPPVRPLRRLILPCLSLLGLVSLSYLLGAAVLFFDLPSADFLRRAFLGAAAWYEESHPPPSPPDQRPPITVGRIDKPDKTYDGFTLCLCSGGPRALLVNMHGEVVHEWHVSLQTVRPDTRGRVPVEESALYFNDAHLGPNGDLLVLVEGPGNARNPSEGYGLVKLDKDSHVLWTYLAACHHAFDVAEDGTVYTLTYDFVHDLPPGLESIPVPCIVDCVDVVSPGGKLKKRIRLLEAFLDSPYAPLCSTLEKPQLFNDLTPPESPMPAVQDAMRRRDILHTNAVRVLSRALAPKFPAWKAGQLLVSPRHLDAIAVLDPDSSKVVWAAQGPWHAQHDPSFLDNGHLLLFDNLGSAKGSRVLEYDPRTQAFSWSYPDGAATRFYSRLRGKAQRLPNGNTLIVNSDGGEVFEVTAGREVVWSCSFGRVSLNSARRYGPGELSFLKDVQHARP